MKTTVAVCVTLIGIGLAASQLPYLLAQDAPPVEGAAAPAPPPAPEPPPVPNSGAVAGVAAPSAPLPPIPPQPAGQAGMSWMSRGVTVAGDVSGQPAVGYGYTPPTEDGRRVGRRSPVFGLATVLGQPPADPRVRELTEKYNQLEQEVLQLASEFRRMAADSPEREAAIKKITEITQQQFQLRHDARQMEIEKLKKQLEDLQGKLQRREEKREQIVQQRVDQLTDQKDELRWEPLDPAGAAQFDPYGVGTRYVPYGDVYRSGVAVPPAVVYGGQQIPPHAAQPAFPRSARDGQQPAMAFPGMPVNPGNSNEQPPMPSPIQNPLSADGMLPPAEMDLTLTPNPIAQSIMEAKVRLESTEQELKTLKAQFEAGQIPSRELQRAEAEKKMAEAAYEMAKQQHDLQLKMRDLDLRRAQVALDAAKAELEAKVAEAGDRHNPTIDASIRKAKANLAQMELDVARAEAMLQAIQQQLEEKEQESEPEPETQPRRSY